MKQNDGSIMDMLSLLNDDNEEVQEFLSLKSLDHGEAGNTIRDRLELIVNDTLLGKAMENYHIKDQLQKIRIELQSQRVEIYTSFFRNPPVMNRPLLICLKCLLIWSPVFDPSLALPKDIGLCPNDCNKHLFELGTN